MPAPTFIAPDARHVRHLRLRANRKQDASKAAISIEDALRTATLPCADQGTWYLIRKLDLGSVSAGLSPTLLSLHIERVAKSIPSLAVPFQLPYADRSNVVSFPSRQEALLQFAIRLIEGKSIREWYWAKILTKKTSSPLPLNLLAPTLTELFREQTPHRAIARLIPHALASSHFQAFINSLSLNEINFWFHDYCISFSDTVPQPEESRPSVSPAANALIEKVLQYLPRDDPRTRFLAIAILSHQHPPSTPPHQLARAAELTILEVAKTPHFASPAKSDQPLSNPSTLPTNEATDDPIQNQAETPPLSANRSKRDASPLSSNESPAENEPLKFSTDQPSKSPDRIPSEFCGIVFIIPLLNQLGFQRYLKTLPRKLEPSFTTHLLINFLQRLGAAKDEPLLTILSERCEDTETPSSESLELWYAAIKTVAKKRLKMPLKSIVNRKGFIRYSDTHLDLFFDFSQIDIRLRRAALDTNPGWTPSLAWIISIHYLDIHEFNA